MSTSGLSHKQQADSPPHFRTGGCVVLRCSCAAQHVASFLLQRTAVCRMTPQKFVHTGRIALCSAVIKHVE